MSLMDIITGMGMYLCTLVFFFFEVAVGSLQYHIGVAKPTIETLEEFIETLRFPLTVYKYYPHQNLNDLQKSSKLVGIINRLIGLFFTSIPLVILVSELMNSAKNQNISVVVLYIFWIILYFVTLFYALRFGQKLKQLVLVQKQS